MRICSITLWPLFEFGFEMAQEGSNDVITVDEFSQASYGDFWTDSGTNCLFEQKQKRHKTWKSPVAQKNIF